MPIEDSDVNKIKQSLEKANTVLILTVGGNNIDSLAASLGIYYSLLAAGKKIRIISPNKVTKQTRLHGTDKIGQTLEESSNFIITLPYQENSIEKVSYNITGDKFNLVIEPRPGFSFSSQDVSFSEGIGKIDLIFTVGVMELNQLGQLASQVEKLRKKAPLINIDIHSENKNYGDINLVHSQAASLSEIITKLLQTLNISLNTEAASNLLIGIKEATNNFTSEKTTADTYEAAAKLSRVATTIKKSSSNIAEAKKQEKKSFAFKPTTPTSITSQTGSSPATDSQVITTMPEDSSSKDKKTPPLEWLKPKILTSSNNTDSSASNQNENT